MEQWEIEYEKLWERDYQIGPVTATCSEIPGKEHIKVFIQSQRTAAQREILETILREDIPSKYPFNNVRQSRLEARLKALTSNT